MPDGTTCPECEDGRCSTCDGTGFTEAYYYKGKKVSVWADFWLRWLFTGVLGIFGGLVCLLAEVFPSDAPSYIVLERRVGIVFIPVGIYLIVWSLRLRAQRIGMMKIAHGRSRR